MTDGAGAMRLVWLTLFLCCLASAPRGQCTVVPNTGCPSTPPPACGGAAQLGQVVSLECSPRGLSLAGPAAVAIGLPGAIAIPFGGPGWCDQEPCVLGITPGALAWVSASTARAIRIPEDPAIVTTTIWMQCVYRVASATGGACWAMTPAASFTIQS